MLLELLKSVDDGTYYSLDHATRQFDSLANLMRLGDWLGSYVAVGILLLLTLILFILQARFRAAQLTLAASLVGVAIVEALRAILPAQRPAVASSSVDAAEMLCSFPSGKVFMFTLVAVLLLFAAWGVLHRAPARLLLTTTMVVLILWIAMSQLMLGLHFVTDVAAGLFGGLALALLAGRFLTGERNLGAVELPDKNALPGGSG